MGNRTAETWIENRDWRGEWVKLYIRGEVKLYILVVSNSKWEGEWAKLYIGGGGGVGELYIGGGWAKLYLGGDGSNSILVS